MRERDRHPSQKGGLRLASLGVLLALLIVPILALREVASVVQWQLIAGYFAIVFSDTYLLYRRDKRQAETGGWRTPESTLHLCEFAGGWPAAFLAQRLLRHKISKRSYQFKFWMIIACHEGIAFDFLQGWPLLRLAGAQLA